MRPCSWSAVWPLGFTGFVCMLSVNLIGTLRRCLVVLQSVAMWLVCCMVFWLVCCVAVWLFCHGATWLVCRVGGWLVSHMAIWPVCCVVVWLACCWLSDFSVGLLCDRFQGVLRRAADAHSTQALGQIQRPFGPNLSTHTSCSAFPRGCFAHLMLV